MQARCVKRCSSNIDWLTVLLVVACPVEMHGGVGKDVEFIDSSPKV